MVGAKIRAVYDEQAKERQRASGGDHTQKPVMENFPQPDGITARDAAGSAVGVSGKTIDQATKVLTQGTPELIQATVVVDLDGHRAGRR
jgi:hypothetical protein